jgi:uncharacterized protein YuzE
MKPSNTIGNRKQYFVKNTKCNYDKDNDLLYIYKQESCVYSNVMIGEFHLEFNKNGEVIGVEILNASELLAEYDIPQKTLQNIEKTELKVVVRNNSLIVFLIIRSLNQEKSATITMNNIESPIMQAIASA